MKRIESAGLCALALGFSADARADDFACSGELGAVALDNVVVPARASCLLLGTDVAGNVLVKPGGALRVEGIQVGGNVQAEGALSVRIHDSYVKGNVQLKATRVRGSGVCNSRIDGNVQLEANRVPLKIGCEEGNEIGGDLQISNSLIARGGEYAIEVAKNWVKGNLQFEKNSAFQGDFKIAYNDVGGNLQCFENRPVPEARGNTVAGNTEGQCARRAAGW